MSAQERYAALLGVLERAEVDGLGDGAGGRAGPRDRFGVRVGIKNPKFAAVRLAIAGRMNADRPAAARTGVGGVLPHAEIPVPVNAGLAHA